MCHREGYNGPTSPGQRQGIGILLMPQQFLYLMASEFAERKVTRPAIV